MGFLDSVYSPVAVKAEAPSPLDPFWYSDPGASTDSGINVSADTALQYSVVWACVRLISQTVAGLPLFVYRHLPQGGKERASSHPLYDVLHSRANARMTSYQWREMTMIHLLLRGNAYSVIAPGPRGLVDKLIPLHPDQVTIKEAPDGSFHYKYQQPGKEPIVYLQEEILHIVGPSLDGRIGLSVISLARQGVGLSMAMESYGAKYFRDNATPRVVLKHPGTFSDVEVRNRVRDSWQGAHANRLNAHSTAVLEEGMDVQPIGISNEDSQFLESRTFQVSEVARWFLVKPHKVNELSRTTFNNIEHQSIEHNQDTIEPWTCRLEQTFTKDLIIAPDTYFAEFLLEGLLRGDSKSRAEFYASAITNGWMSRNEVRERENLNPVDGLDEFLQPLNMASVGQVPPEPQRAQVSVLEPAAIAADSESTVKALELAEIAATRLVKREIERIANKAPNYGSGGKSWEQWLESFYGRHRRVMRKELPALSDKAAERYCDEQIADLLANGIETMESWEEKRPPVLARWAIGGTDDEV